MSDGSAKGNARNRSMCHAGSTAHVSLAVHDYAEPGGSPLPGADSTFFRAVHQSAICKGPGDSLWFQESFPLRCSMRGSHFIYSFRPSSAGVHSLAQANGPHAVISHEVCVASGS